jgi:RHS repeat-associated protein
LNRRVSVTDKSTNLLVAEYAYLASGERIAALKYSGGEVSDYTRYVREGGAVVWEKSDGTGHEKRYIYAGGRMAYTEEAWVTCALPKLASSPTQSLASLQVAPDANGQTVTATIALPGLPEEAQATEVRLVKGNSLVASQRIDKPEGGQWCGVEQATFAGLLEGNDYQAGITLFFREGRAKVMPLKPYLIQRMKLGIVKGKLAAWTIKRLKADNDNVSEETTTGFAGLAPENAEDYTALVAQGGAMQAVAQGQQADNAEVPAGANSVSVQGSAGTSVSLAAPSLGTTTTRGGGLIIPQCTKHALNTYYATDHLGTVKFTKTIDETGAVTTTTHDYEPFGVEITPTDECDNTHKFTGHERDLETGNDYMHFRFFSSNMGRFQKPDSVFGSPGNPQNWNLYSYAGGNPVNRNDPTGHWYRVAGEGAGRRSNNPMPCSSPFVEPSVDLDDYLWGGAKLTEHVIYAYINGELVASYHEGADRYWGVAGNTSLVVAFEAHGFTEGQAKGAIQYLLNFASYPDNFAVKNAKGKVTGYREVMFAFVKDSAGVIHPAKYPSDAPEEVNGGMLAEWVLALNDKLPGGVMLWGHIHRPGAPGGLSAEGGDKTAAMATYNLIMTNPRYEAIRYAAAAQIAIGNDTNSKGIWFWGGSKDDQWYRYPLVAP